MSVALDETMSVKGFLSSINTDVNIFEKLIISYRALGHLALSEILELPTSNILTKCPFLNCAATLDKNYRSQHLK